MKFQVTVKDPDVLHDAVEESVEADVKTLNLPEDEAELLIESRMDKVMEAMGKWWKYSEYITLEFDTDAMTATVIERAAH